jgi:hypothetical protein
MVERRQTRSIDASANNIDQKTNPKSNLSLSVCGTGNLTPARAAIILQLLPSVSEGGTDKHTCSCLCAEKSQAIYFKPAFPAQRTMEIACVVICVQNILQERYYIPAYFKFLLLFIKY